MPLPAIVSALTRLGASGAAGGIEGGGALYKGAGGVANQIFSGSAAGSVVGQGISTLIAKIGEAAHAATHPLETMQKGMDRFKQTMTSIPATIIKARETIVGIGAAWTEALASPIKVVKELGDVVGQFTQLSNPAGMKQFHFRVENAFATIGNSLQPILDALTRSAEKMGDTFAKLKPAIAPAVRAVESLIDFFATRFADAMILVAPLIEGVSLAFQGLVQNFLLIQGPITAVIRKFTELRRNVLEFLGLPTGANPDARSDIAVREPRYATGTEQIQRELAKNSLMASLGAPQERKDVPSLLKILVDFVKENLSSEVLFNTFLRALNEARRISIDAATSSIPGVGIATSGANVASGAFSVRDEALAELARKRRIQNQE